MTLAAAHLHMLKWSYQKCFRRRERPDRDIGRKREMKEEAYKILFLEDEPTIREVLTEYMLMSGYQVIGAERATLPWRGCRSRSSTWLCWISVCPGRTVLRC